MKNIAINVKERVQKLSQLDKQMQQDYIKSCINKNYTVIVEQFNNGFYEGHTENYIKCYIQSTSKINQNQVIKVKLKEFYNDGATAEIIK